MQQELIKLGFSEHEAIVYLAVLTLGQATVGQIAKKAGINRTSGYDIVRRLWEWGMVHEVAGTKKQTFATEAPSRLAVYLEQRSKVAEHHAKQAHMLLPALQFLRPHATFRPQVQLFEGSEGIKKLYDTSLEGKGPIRAFLSAESLEGFDPKYVYEYFRKRAAKKIFIRAIMADDSVARKYQKQDKALLRETRIVPHEKMDVRPETYIYDDHIAFFSLREKVGVCITSPDMAKALRKLFDLSWERAGEYSGKFVRKE